MNHDQISHALQKEKEFLFDQISDTEKEIIYILEKNIDEEIINKISGIKMMRTDILMIRMDLYTKEFLEIKTNKSW